jgi:hypothetical protein
MVMRKVSYGYAQSLLWLRAKSLMVMHKVSIDCTYCGALCLLPTIVISLQEKNGQLRINTKVLRNLLLLRHLLVQRGGGGDCNDLAIWRDVDAIVKIGMREGKGDLSGSNEVALNIMKKREKQACYRKNMSAEKRAQERERLVGKNLKLD